MASQADLKKLVEKALDEAKFMVKLREDPAAVAKEMGVYLTDEQIDYFKTTDLVKVKITGLL